MLSYNIKPKEIQQKVNFATTVIPEYDTAGADNEDCCGDMTCFMIHEGSKICLALLLAP